MGGVRTLLQNLLRLEFEAPDTLLIDLESPSEDDRLTIMLPGSPPTVPDGHEQDALQTAVYGSQAPAPSDEPEATLLEHLDGTEVTQLAKGREAPQPSSTPQLSSPDESWWQSRLRDFLIELEDLPEGNELATFDEAVLHPFENRHPEIVVKELESALKSELKANAVVRLAEGNMGWVFLVTGADGEKKIVKVPKLSLSEHSASFYERELQFFQNFVCHFKSHGDSSWYPEYLDEGQVMIQGRSFRYGVFEYCRGPLRDSKAGKTDSALTLRDAMSFFEREHPVPSLLVVEHMLLSLLELQELGQGVIHRDLKPENYFLTPKIAQSIWSLIQSDAPQLDIKKLAQLCAEIREQSQRIKTNDFGLVLEMKPSFLTDPVADAEGDVMAGCTRRYANWNDIQRHGAYAHSDRFSIACVLYEMICGFAAQSEQGREKGGYIIPNAATPQQKVVIELAIGVLEDKREGQEHRDNVREVEITKEFLTNVQHLIAVQMQELNPGIATKVRRGVTGILRRLTGN